MYNSDVFLQIPGTIVYTHAEKRDLLRLPDYFQRENADETFRTHTILRKGIKTVESLLFHAFTFVSWKMGSETSRKVEHDVSPRAIFFLQSIYGPGNVQKAIAVDVFIFILSDRRA